jgi:hypothetical protein
MCFPAQLFTIKRNLVFMNNLYNKVAVASVCTVLGFALSSHEEAKAVTLTLAPTINFEVLDYSNRVGNEDDDDYTYEYDGVGDSVRMEDNSYFGKVRVAEGRLFAEFNIDSFSSIHEDITRVLLQTQIGYLGGSVGEFRNPGSFGLFGYAGNGTGDLSDFGAGVLLSSVKTSFSYSYSRGDFLSINVTPFVKQRVSNGDPFAGFGFRVFNPGFVELGGDSFPDYPVTLVVETVPEPTTIFGSAIFLGVGGWLKRKKSSQQNKARSQA